MKSFGDQGVNAGADVDTAAAEGLATGAFPANIQPFLFRQFWQNRVLRIDAAIWRSLNSCLVRVKSFITPMFMSSCSNVVIPGIVVHTFSSFSTHLRAAWLLISVSESCCRRLPPWVFMAMIPAPLSAAYISASVVARMTFATSVWMEVPMNLAFPCFLRVL